MVASEKLRHINSHVIEDIEDYIMLQAFKSKNVEEVKKLIEDDLTQRKKKKGKSKEEEEEEKAEDRRRKFLDQMRPPFVWNFFEPQDVLTPHILRAEADTAKCYADGRVESLMEDINQIAIHLTKHEDIRWKSLVNFTLEIFKAEFKREQELAAEEAAAQAQVPTKK